MDEENIESLREAILAFYDEHAAARFRVLREIGVQAALKRLCDEALGSDNDTVTASIYTPSDEHAGLPPVTTDRVRLEARVRLPSEQKQDPNESQNPAQEIQRKRTDLIMYKSKEVRLFREANGPGDIIYRTEASDVLAAVEIKSDPSHRIGQKRGYARDLCRLIALREHGIPACFFIILDKSSPLYGDFPDRKLPFNHINWEPQLGAETILTDLIGPPKGETSWDDIWISRDQPDSKIYVEIFNMSAEDRNQVKLYAFRRPIDDGASPPT